ncbi:MFS transporter [Deinococcus yavapaiensis]|uniref:EmrB/QacA subfamily drug resistance transporter n=1 Tax=Deinococcus yavapaiensis KR-236 TaxID=694435 RepID=A0A318S4P4_9DEIO|nr:MFS transporter [Deinococcus yavapaiensis]PYE50443.1 EmrB/QacA subfamily drug resistance transporter [Deinococcus yavapaiensis KR-236]
MTRHASQVTPQTGSSPWPVFLTASIAVLLISIDATVLYAAFPALSLAFSGAQASDLSWVLNAYTVVYAVLLVPAGRFADLYGRKRMFLIGLLIFLVASLGCGLSGQVWMLIVFRALQAVGAAALLPASLAVVLGAFPTERRAVAVSLWGAVSALGAAVGPSLGSWLIDLGGWPWAFYLNLPLGVLSVWGASRLLKSSAPEGIPARLDAVGLLLLMVGVGAIALGLVRSEALGWTSAAVSGSLIAGLLLLLVFVWWARRITAPAIDLTLFDNMTYRFVNLATLTFGMAFSMMFFSYFLFMSAIWHLPLDVAGVAILPGPLLVIPTSVVSGRLASRLGHRPLLVTGSLVFAAGALWTLLVPGLTPSYLTHWLPALLLTGLGTGMVLPSLSAAAVSRLNPARFGVGSAVNQAVRQIGTVLGVAVTVALLGGAAAQLADFRTVFGWEVALCVVTAALCLSVDTRPQRLKADA